MAVLFNKFERNKGYTLLAHDSAGWPAESIAGPDSFGLLWSVGSMGTIRAFDLAGNLKVEVTYGSPDYRVVVLDGHHRPWTGNVNTGYLHPINPDGSLGLGPRLFSTVFFYPLGAVFDPFADKVIWLGYNHTIQGVRAFALDYKSETISTVGNLLNIGGPDVIDQFDMTFWGYSTALPNSCTHFLTFASTNLWPTAQILSSASTAGLAGAHWAFWALYLGSDLRWGVGAGPVCITKCSSTGVVALRKNFPDALRVSDFVSDDSYLYATVAGTGGVGNRVEKMDANLNTVDTFPIGSDSGDEIPHAIVLPEELRYPALICSRSALWFRPRQTRMMGNYSPVVSTVLTEGPARRESYAWYLTSAPNPTSVTNLIGGKLAFYFQGNSYFDVKPDESWKWLHDGSPWTFIYVFKCNNFALNAQGLLTSMVGAIDPNLVGAVVSFEGISGELHFYIGNGSGTFMVNLRRTTLDKTKTNIGVVRVGYPTSTSATIRTYVQGNLGEYREHTQSFVGAPAATDLTALRLGKSPTGAGWLRGWLAEAVLIRGALVEDEVKDAVQYLAAQWF